MTLVSDRTTAFRWPDLGKIADQTTLKQVGHEFVPPKSDAPGAAGKEILTFKALKQGDGETAAMGNYILLRSSFMTFSFSSSSMPCDIGAIALRVMPLAIAT